MAETRNDFVETLLAEWTESIHDKMEWLVAEINDDIRHRISIPVEYVGDRVIRSVPGEAPRYETGSYWESWQSQTYVDGEVVTGIVYTDDFRGDALEDKFSRPHVLPTFLAWKEEAKQRLIP